jgi:hypothetical protein
MGIFDNLYNFLPFSTIVASRKVIDISGWIKPQQTLRKRWDNVEHFPNLRNFPPHLPIGEEFNVEPSCSIKILELIDLIENDLHS